MQKKADSKHVLKEAARLANSEDEGHRLKSVRDANFVLEQELTSRGFKPQKYKGTYNALLALAENGGIADGSQLAILLRMQGRLRNKASHQLFDPSIAEATEYVSCIRTFYLGHSKSGNKETAVRATSKGQPLSQAVSATQNSQRQVSKKRTMVLRKANLSRAKNDMTVQELLTEDQLSFFENLSILLKKYSKYDKYDKYEDSYQSLYFDFLPLNDVIQMIDSCYSGLGKTLLSDFTKGTKSSIYGLISEFTGEPQSLEILEELLIKIWNKIPHGNFLDQPLSALNVMYHENTKACFVVVYLETALKDYIDSEGKKLWVPAGCKQPYNNEPPELVIEKLNSIKLDNSSKKFFLADKWLDVLNKNKNDNKDNFSEIIKSHNPKTYDEECRFFNDIAKKICSLYPNFEASIDKDMRTCHVSEQEIGFSK